MTMSLVVEHFDDLLATPEDVEQLNRAILQLAMQGKLVEQNSNDEPAGELLKHIRADNTKESKPALEITEDEQPFELPCGWKWVRLGELCCLENGDRSKANYPNKSILVKEGVPFVNAGHLVDGRIDRSTITFIPKERFDRLRSGKFANGDILFCLRGSLGKSAIVEGFDAGAIASSLVILKIHPYLSNYYLLNYFDSPLASEMIKKYDNGTAQPNLSAASLAKFLIPLPPLAEQQRIVARVEELFAQTRALAKELTHSQIELDGLNKSALSHLLASETPEQFDQYWAFIAEHFDLLFQSPEHVAPLRQSILELAVRGKLTRRDAGDESARELLKRVNEEKEKTLISVKEDDEPYKLPMGWEWARFENIANIATNSVQPDDFQDFPHVAPNYIEKGTGRLLDYKTVAEDDVRSINHRFFPGQLLYSKIRPNLSKAVIVDFEGLCSADMYPLDVFIDSRYLLRFILSSVFLKMVIKSDTRVAMPKVNQNELNKVLIAVPPLAEQERIVKRVEQLWSLCDALEARLQSAEEERGRLVASVMAGVGS